MAKGMVKEGDKSTVQSMVQDAAQGCSTVYHKGVVWHFILA